MKSALIGTLIVRGNTLVDARMGTSDVSFVSRWASTKQKGAMMARDEKVTHVAMKYTVLIDTSSGTCIVASSDSLTSVNLTFLICQLNDELSAKAIAGDVNLSLRWEVRTKSGAIQVIPTSIPTEQSATIVRFLASIGSRCPATHQAVYEGSRLIESFRNYGDAVERGYREKHRLC